jgi:hypothetical protein
MMRSLVLWSLVVFGLLSTAGAGFSQAPAAATPESAAAFIGDWTLSAQGDQGPAQFGLSVKVEEGKLVASIAMGQGGTQPITDISLSGKTLVLRYNIDYNGNAIDVSVSITPGGDKAALQIAFAGGAYTMSGTAEKKK